MQTLNQWTLTLSPKRLFLLDGLGACLTAFLLGVVLTAFNEHFGMPQKTLNILALIALVFAFYSFFCFFFIGNNWRLFLKIIAAANLLYCCLTITLVIYFYPHLTVLGVIYFLLEIVVVCALVFIELRFAFVKFPNMR
jgi:hypothetical protein